MNELWTKDQMTAKEFKEKWEKEGNKTNSKGRPILNQLQELPLKSKDSQDYSKSPLLENKKVRGATKVYDEKGVKIADSKWEYTCMRMLETAGLKPEKQRRFEILPTIKDRGCKRTLSKRTWSPDFTFEDLKIVADAKGWTTEMARIKMHMFLDKYFLWEVYVLKTEKDVYDLIEIIKERRGK